MKALLFTITLLVSGHASAALITNYFTTQPCRFWSSQYIQGTGMVNTCSSVDMTQYVPDAHSVDRNFQNLDARVQALEQRIQQLEKANP